MLIDEARKELSELRDALVGALDELAHIVRTNMLTADMRDPATATAEYDVVRPNEMHGRRHLTPSKTLLAPITNHSPRMSIISTTPAMQVSRLALFPAGSRILAQSTAYAVACADSNKFKRLLNVLHQFNTESNAELHRRLGNQDPLSNHELFAFHAIRIMLNDLVRYCILATRLPVYISMLIFGDGSRCRLNQ